jgi:uncharacterized protein
VLSLPKSIFVPLLMALSLGCSNSQAGDSQASHEVAAPRSSIDLVGRVTDAANVLTNEQETGLSTKLESLERTTGRQMIVVTVPTLGGQDIAAFSRDLANSWGIGREGYDDGVVLLVAPNEHEARIAVGYGLEQTLPDSLCQQIMAKQMIPRFQQSDLAGGIEAGVDALSSHLR